MVIFVDCVSSLCAGLISDLILQFVSVQLQLLLRYRWFPRRLLKFTVQEVASTGWIQPREVSKERCVLSG